MPKSIEPQSLDHLLAQVSRLHHARIHELLSGTGMFRGQPPVLEALAEQDGLTHGELAAFAHVTPATMSRMIKRMECAKLLVTRRDPTDKRVSRVYLTNNGRTMRSTIQRAFNTSEADTFADFDMEDRVLLRRFLMQIRSNLIRLVGEEILR
ncbi:MAG TPA: MarR family transcriptional regulator [Anaerolineae bacterium]|jgi:DNA-binding MarR family transcriptional regulator